MNTRDMIFIWSPLNGSEPYQMRGFSLVTLTMAMHGYGLKQSTSIWETVQVGESGELTKWEEGVGMTGGKWERVQ